VVLRNSVTFNQSSACTSGRGVVLRGAQAQLKNNGIIGPTCNGASSTGVEIIAASRSGDGITPEPLLHSNSILSHAWFGSTPAVPAVQAGVRLSPPSGPSIGLGTRVGTFTNNIIQAGPGGMRTIAFEEANAGYDPRFLNRNDFLISGVDGGTLYLDENVTPLSTAAAINALIDTTPIANVSLVPQFSSIQFNFPHLTNASPLRGLGPGPTIDGGAPNDDWDGQARPNPAGSTMDIGADEVP
jgi:hypothetical protein